MFKILDTLRPTLTGLNHLPSWFLRLGAPVFCKPLARLFTLSIATSTVPSQWKTAYIRPIPKVPAPLSHADFRPISLTPVLTRVMEKIVVRQVLYPSFITPPPTLNFQWSICLQNNRCSCNNNNKPLLWKRWSTSYIQSLIRRLVTLALKRAA